MPPARDLGPDAASPSASQPPAQLGKYRLFKRLGAGMMGTVWLSHHPDLDIPVALKTIRADLQERHPDFIDRFCREARTAARINHCSAVRIYDAGVDQEQYYLVMEYVPGGTAADLIKPGQPPLTIARALELVTGVAQALAAAAELGIVHRDIKPENIMLDHKGTPKLADLGLAKLTTENDTQLTLTGVAFGTPSYLAPEQALDARNVDIRADIYALGATFYQLLTGRLPFQADSVFQMIKQHLESPPPDATEARPDVPRAVAETIRKMMAKAPADRYQTPAELVQVLQRLALAGDSASGLAAPTGQRAALRPLLYAALTLLVAAGLAAYAVYARRPANSRPAPAQSARLRPPQTAAAPAPTPLAAGSVSDVTEGGAGLGEPRAERRFGPGVRRPGPLAESFTRATWRAAVKRSLLRAPVALLPDAEPGLTPALANLGLKPESFTWSAFQQDAQTLAGELSLVIYTGRLPITTDASARLDAIAAYLAAGGLLLFAPTCDAGQDDLILTQLTVLGVDAKLLPAATASTHYLRPRLPLSALVAQPQPCRATSPLLLIATADTRGVFLSVQATAAGEGLGAAATLVIHHRDDGPPGVLALTSAPALASVDAEALCAAMILGAHHAVREGPTGPPLE